MTNELALFALDDNKWSWFSYQLVNKKTREIFINFEFNEINVISQIMKDWFSMKKKGTNISLLQADYIR